ncbi:MAG: hypothetical protein R3F14_38790 [Polyangiaceae bacterium]
MPALLTRPLSPPICSCAHATNASHSVSFETSSFLRKMPSGSAAEALLVHVTRVTLAPASCSLVAEYAHATGAAGHDDLEIAQLHFRQFSD